MAFAEDLALFVNDSTPGHAACVINSLAVTGLFDSAFDDPLGIGSSQPVLWVREAATGAIAQGAAITVGAVAYTVREVQPDGFGLTRLTLEKA